MSLATAREERIVNPKVLDAVNDALALLAANQDQAAEGRRQWTDVGLDWLVIDISDAFWLIPLLPSERKFFVFKFRGKYYVYLYTAQGSRGAPLTWGRVGALLCRLTQGVLPGDRARLSMFVDDPLLAVRGPKRRRRRLAYILITVWSALGFPLAFRTGDFETKVAWIGALIK